LTNGVVIIARNNQKIDYLKQAAFAANRVKKYLNVPVSLITDSINVENDVFDKIITIDDKNDYTFKNFNNGNNSKQVLAFKNTSRSTVYELSPYDNTLLIDSDYLISNNQLAGIFDSSNNFMIYQKGFELSGWRNLKEFDYISETGPPFYWATVVFFKKSNESKIFFELLKHIQDNWTHYRRVYQITTTVFRNDHAFSIAIHIMNNFSRGNFAKLLPGSLFYTTDRDILVDIKDDEFVLLIEEKKSGQYLPAKIKGQNLHVMNKFSLNEFIK
jgi:hypothetical protein